MSNITQFSSGGSGGTTFNRREVIVGPVSTTWTAGSTGIVEVNCWGGGGNGGQFTGGSGGGGGGYVRYIYDLTAGDQLSIIVGGSGGTSSVSCPTQSPTSPISATGGSVGLNPGPTTPGSSGVAYADGGAGGVGSGTVPAPRIGYLLTRSGGSGNGGKQKNPAGPHIGGGGGCAGSPFGDGLSGVPVESAISTYSEPEGARGGNGIGGVGIDTTGGLGNWLINLGAPADLPYIPWFNSTDLIGGNGGNGTNENTPTDTTDATAGSFLAGGGGGMRPSSPPVSPPGASGAAGGYCGGGGGTAQILTPTTVAGTGGVGLVMIYYTI